MSASPPRIRAILPSALAIAFALLLGGCDGEDKIIVENMLPSQENRPPSIVAYSPQFPPQGFELVAGYSNSGGIALTVIAGDPDGLDDISAVTVDIDSVVLKRFVMRADTSTAFCPEFSYALNDTVPTQQILATPAAFPRVTLMPLRNMQGGIYVTDTFGAYGFGFPDIYQVASYLQQWGGGCSTNDASYGHWEVVPPVLPSTRQVLLTYLDVQYIGIRIKVWDTAGAVAVKSLPDVRVVYTTEREKKGI